MTIQPDDLPLMAGRGWQEKQSLLGSSSVRFSLFRLIPLCLLRKARSLVRIVGM